VGRGQLESYSYCKRSSQFFSGVSAKPMVECSLPYILNKKFWEELIAYFPLIRHAPHRKRRLQLIFFCRGNVFIEPLPSKDGGGGYTDKPHRLSFDTTRTAQKTTRPTILLCSVYSLPREVFTDPLPSNDRGIHIQTQD
jgi:hypothetical protein